MILAPRFLPRLAATVGCSPETGSSTWRGDKACSRSKATLSTPKTTQEMTLLLKGMARIANRIMMGLVLAGPPIASSSLLQFGLTLGLAGIVTAAGTGLYLVVTIIISDRQSDADR
ncbi:MAG: hypothetical protein ABIR58_05300 [Gemmatimonadaceae bacterium]